MTNQLVTEDSHYFSWEDMIQLTTTLHLYHNTLQLPQYLHRSSDHSAQVALAAPRHLCCVLLLSPHHNASDMFKHLAIMSSDFSYILLTSYTKSASTYWSFDQCRILHTFVPFCAFCLFCCTFSPELFCTYPNVITMQISINKPPDRCIFVMSLDCNAQHLRSHELHRSPRHFHCTPIQYKWSYH